jgi:MFS family permease
MRIALRHPRFGRLLAALAVSCAGDWIYNLALLAYVEQQTHSSAWLGATTAARVLPIVLVGPLGGVIADRFDRRRVMIASDVVRAGLMVALAAVAVAGLPIVLVPLLAALATLAAAPQPPAVAASTPQLVPQADLPAANAARAAIMPVCVVAGPGLGALLLLVGPPSLAFALNGLTFVASAALVASIPAGPAFRPVAAEPDAPRPSLRADVRTGAAALAGQAAACRLVAADVACSIAYGAQTVLLVLVAGRLGLGADGYGYLLAGFGAGGVLGAALGGRLADARRPRLVLGLALATVALPLPLMAAGGGLGWTLGLAVLGGGGAVLVEVLTDTGLQRALAPEVLGRAYGLAFPAAVGGIAVGSLAAPLLVAAVGLQGAMVGIGVLVALVAVAVVGRPVARAPMPVPMPVPAPAVG